MKAVIDSDVLIDFLQGAAEAKEELEHYDEPLYSIISWMEVMSGAKTENERESAESLFHSLAEVPITRKVAAKAVEERQSLRLKLPDAIILASADIEGCILVTRNSKDFDAEDPRIRFPYSL